MTGLTSRLGSTRFIGVRLEEIAGHQDLGACGPRSTSGWRIADFPMHLVKGVVIGKD